jgi:hypothetical protein
MLAGMTYLTVKVPGRFRADVAFLDVETRKVPTDGFVMQNGEALRNRWQAFLVGMARDGEILIAYHPVEAILLRDVRSALYWHKAIAYSATREFDEMVLKGRFTNARRAHEPEPFYPHLFRPQDWEWRNMRKEPSEPMALRGNDVPSRDVPDWWATRDPGKRMTVYVHLLRDVAELVARYGEPDDECWAWCQAVFSNYDYAKGQLGKLAS